LKIGTEALRPMADCFEYGNELSGSIIWKNFLLICVTKNFLKRLGIKFYFTFLHICTIHLKSPPLLSRTCSCVIYIFFRELSLFLTDGEADFGPVRGVTSIVVVRVPVPLVTVVINWSAMVLEGYLRSPWLR